MNNENPTNEDIIKEISRLSDKIEKLEEKLEEKLYDIKMLCYDILID